MKVRYTLVLDVDGQLSPEERAEVADELQSAAAGVLCDLYGGDSGEVALRFEMDPA